MTPEDALVSVSVLLRPDRGSQLRDVRAHAVASGAAALRFRQEVSESVVERVELEVKRRVAASLRVLEERDAR